MESKGKALGMNDIPDKKNEDVEMEDHQENEEPAHCLSWDNFKSHCKKKARQDGHFDVICKYCKKIYKFQDGDNYEKLEQHMQEEHPQEFAVELTQMQETEYVSSQSSSKVFVYCHAKVVEGLTKMIAMHRLPFNLGDSRGALGDFMKSINPEYEYVSSQTVGRTLKGLYKKGKRELIDLFANMDGFFIGCDTWHDWEYTAKRESNWMSYVSYSYIRVTCYWIDDNWQRQQRVLGFRIDEMDTIDNKFKLMKRILKKYKLDSKNFAVSFDNSRSTAASVDELQRICRSIFHIKLDCHVLNFCINSCVEDCLKHLEEYIEPIKNAASVIFYDVEVWREWRRFCKNHNKIPKRFSIISPTYWHSAHRLLRNTFEYRELLCEFTANNVPQKTINLQNWDFCENLLNVLRITENAIHTLCGVYKPNSHLFLVEALNIVGELQEAEKSVFLKDAILAMKKQWLNHYKTIPSVYLIAFVFDPRCKLEGLEEYLTVYYDLLNLDQDEQVNVQAKVSEIRTLIYDIYSDIYASKDGSSYSSSTHATPLSNELGLGDRMHQQRHKRLRFSKPSSNSELDFYLTTAFEFDDSVTGKEFPVLEWWKKHESIFPCLSKMVKQILGAPVSTITVKEALWDGFRYKTLNERESCRSIDLLEAQVCVADWSKVEFKKQEENDLSDDDDDYDSEMETSESEDKIEE